MLGEKGNYADPLRAGAGDSALTLDRAAPTVRVALVFGSRTRPRVACLAALDHASRAGFPCVRRPRPCVVPWLSGHWLFWRRSSAPAGTRLPFPAPAHPPRAA